MNRNRNSKIIMSRLIMIIKNLCQKETLLIIIVVIFLNQKLKLNKWMKI